MEKQAETKQVRYFDAHTHAQFAAFDDDRDEVIRRALSAGVGLVNVGTQRATSRAAVELARRYNSVYAAVGKHPIHEGGELRDPQELSDATNEKPGFDREAYAELARDPKVVAIGECGLDYFHVSDEGARRRQKELFIAQIELAHELQKPLMIHCREAYADLLEILNRNVKLLIPQKAGIAHFFAGTREEAQRLLELGFFFTFGGVITFTRDYDEVIRSIPMERILSETDAPYVAPMPYRGKRNEPLYVTNIVDRLALLKEESVEKTREGILENASRIFGVKFNAQR